MSPERRRRRGTGSLGAALAWVLGLTIPLSGQSVPPDDAVILEAIRVRVEAGRATGHWAAGGDRLMARVALPEFYQRRGFNAAWTRDGRITADAHELLEAIRDAAADGLDPRDYHLMALEGALSSSEPTSVAAAVDLELLLTDAFLVLGSHLLQGRVNPESIDPEWLANRRQADMAVILEEAIGQGSMRDRLRASRPGQPEYGVLVAALARLRSMAERGRGWGTVEAGATLRPGEQDARVPALRQRLRLSGDLLQGPVPSDSLLFDPRLGAAVASFQERHGLEPDSAVGAMTLAAMNVPLEARIRQLEVNLERWRWLPQELGRRHIRVNLAGFTTELWEDGRPRWTTRSIVGRQYRQTPMFSQSMRYLVLSPYWHVPPTIAAVDKLPLIKQDPGYVASQRMTLIDAASNQSVDPFAVDWSQITGAELNRRYRLRQDPGPANALGDVKFMFPNRHNVYLHDTPSRELFSRSERSFSSGCIRIENPLELARLLLEGQPGWTMERIRSVVAGGKEQSVNLLEPVPVHLLYWTAFVDGEGRLNFRNDIYARDAAVARALAADPPGP